MVKLEKQKTTQEGLPKDSLNDWKEIVWQHNKTDYKFWEESWNDEFED